MFDPEKFEERIREMPMPAYLHELRQLEAHCKKQPKNHEVHFALGLMFLRTDSFKDSVKSFKKAHKINPRSELILKTLSEVLFFNLKNYSEAIRYFRKWGQMRKDLAVLHAHIADCQLKLGKSQDALQSLVKAEEIDANEPKIYQVRADVYTKLGDAEKARANLERYMELDNDPTVASNLLMLPGFEPDRELLEKLGAMAEEMPPEQSTNVLYSHIAAAYEKLGDYDTAFEFLERSNEWGAQRLNKEKTLSAFSNLREAFTPGFMKSHGGRGLEDRGPIFIIGMPRSGTTLTESILAGHPEIEDNGELPFFHSMLMPLGLYQVNNPLLANNLPTLKKALDGAPQNHITEIAESYLEQAGFSKGRARYRVDKLPHNFMSVGLIHLAFPNSTIIHCRRNPIDCALSCYKASFSEFHDYAADLEFLGLYYRQYWELMKYWRELLPGRFFEVYYEDTVSNTELVARNMIAHIGLEWDDRCLDHSSSKKTVATASQWQVRQPIYTSSVAKWKKYEKHLQPMIKTMGSCVEEYETELAALSK